MPAPTPVSERLARMLTPGPGGCQLFTGARDKGGYGSISHGSPRRCRLAHRVAWTLANGEIPRGLYVLHRCDVPACCNPDHLFLGTQRDNLRDCAAKGRVAGQRITPEQVRLIRARREQGAPLRDIAAEFSISLSAASGIARRVLRGDLLPNSPTNS